MDGLTPVFKVRRVCLLGKSIFKMLTVTLTRILASMEKLKLSQSRAKGNTMGIFISPEKPGLFLRFVKE